MYSDDHLMKNTPILFDPIRREAVRVITGANKISNDVGEATRHSLPPACVKKALQAPRGYILPARDDEVNLIDWGVYGNRCAPSASPTNWGLY